MREFLRNNSKWHRLARTILQGVIGVVIANIDIIVGTFNIDPTAKPIITALVMAVLSPVMAELGGCDESC